MSNMLAKIGKRVYGRISGSGYAPWRRQAAPPPPERKERWTHQLHRHPHIQAEEGEDGAAAFDRHFGERKWHCDDIAGDPETPEDVRTFLQYWRLPASDRWERREELEGPEPALFGTTNLGYRVRVTMCSRFGDVGISQNMLGQHGYVERVWLPDLTELSAREVPDGPK